MSRAATPFIPNVPRAQGSFERPERDNPLPRTAARPGVVGDARLPPLCTERRAFENGPRAHGKSHAERHFLSSKTRKYFCACARKLLQMRQLKPRSLTALSVPRARAGSVRSVRNVRTLRWLRQGSELGDCRVRPGNIRQTRL